MDPISDSIAAAALLLSVGTLAWQRIDAYRRRRRLVVEITSSVFLDPARGSQPDRRERWVQIVVAADGGTFSVRKVAVEIPDESAQPPALSMPNLGDKVPVEGAKTAEGVLEIIADPMRERVTIRDGDQHSWIRRATGGPGAGIEATGSWLRARIELMNGKVVRSRWMWLRPDDPTVTPPLPIRPRDARGVYPKSKGKVIQGR